MVSGVSGDGLLATDIFVEEADALRQVTPRKDVLRSASVDGVSYAYPADMDGDGMIEIPQAESLPGAAADSRIYFALRWYSLDSSGKCQKKLLTYQDLNENWYFEFPEFWDGTVLVREETLSTVVSAAHFYRVWSRAEGGRAGH